MLLTVQFSAIVVTLKNSGILHFGAGRELSVARLVGKGASWDTIETPLYMKT